MGSRFISTIDKSGPFFQRDPVKTFRENSRMMVERMAEEGQTDVIAQMLTGQAQRAPISVIGGHSSEHVGGRAQSLKGKRWQSTGIVSINNVGFDRKGGTALMAAASRVEAQTGAFKRTAGRLRRAKAINVSALLKGLQ